VETATAGGSRLLEVGLYKHDCVEKNEIDNKIILLQETVLQVFLTSKMRPFSILTGISFGRTDCFFLIGMHPEEILRPSLPLPEKEGSV
jgi:hypothetical protein